MIPGYTRLGYLLTIIALVCVGSGCDSPRRASVASLVEKRLEKALRSERAPLERPSITAASSAGPQPEVDTRSPEWPEGEGPLRVSVEQAALLALSQNRDLQVRQLNPVIVGTFEALERGAYDPELFLEASTGEERTSEVSRSTEEQFDVEGRDADSVLGIRQRIPTGTDIEATVSHDRSISNRSPEQQTARLGLTVTQQLLRGLSPKANLASIRLAEMDTLASEYELRGFTEALLADVEVAYWNYVLAEKQIAIFERSLNVAIQQRDQIEQRIEVGTLAETQAAAARAEVALQKQALIDARSALNESRLRLLRLMNPASDGRLDRDVIAVSEPTITPEPIRDLEDRIQLSTEARPEVNEALLRLDQARLETVVTRNGLLPRLELFITLGDTGFKDTFGGAFREISGDTYDMRAGVRFSHMLGNRSAKARDRAARVTRDQARRAIDNLRQLVRYEVRLAANEARRAREQIDASTATRELQEKTLEAEQQRFDVGASTALLVAQAQRDLLSSQIAEVEAQVNYRIALVRLYLAEGTLLERRGMAVDETALVSSF